MISDTSIIAAITGLEVASVVTLTTGVVFPISVALASAGLVLGIGSAVIHKTQKIFNSKAKKHDKIKDMKIHQKITMIFRDYLFSEKNCILVGWGRILPPF